MLYYIQEKKSHQRVVGVRLISNTKKFELPNVLSTCDTYLDVRLFTYIFKQVKNATTNIPNCISKLKNSNSVIVSPPPID